MSILHAVPDAEHIGMQDEWDRGNERVHRVFEEDAREI
jgi:hypothetical protein